MKVLRIPTHLEAEFATIEAIYKSTGATRRVDALLLSWVKFEKQLRRLFSFLVFQHPRITEAELESVLSAMADSRDLNPDTFLRAIASLGVRSVPDVLGDDHARLWPEVQRIRSYRNKLMHGQNSGKKLSSHRLERDIALLVEWVSLLGSAASAEYGYDGIGRNTFRAAKSAAKIAVGNYPFQSAETFEQWLKKNAKRGV